MRGPRSVAAILLALASLAVGVLPARAQKSTLPEYVTKPTQQPAGIVSQLQLAITEEKRALAGYEVSGPADDITDYHQAASNAYVLIRAAREGMFQMIGTKKLRNRYYSDPMLDLAFKKVTAAWNRSRAPVDHVNWSGRREDYLAKSRQQLSETIAMLEELLLIFP